MSILKQSSSGDFVIEGNLNCSLDMKMIHEFIGEKMYPDTCNSLSDLVKSMEKHGTYVPPSDNFKPTHIIYSNPVTICFFPDGSKVMVRCTKGEKYIPENGVMACIVNKMFGSRTQFMKLVASGYYQAPESLKIIKILQKMNKSIKKTE